MPPHYRKIVLSNVVLVIQNKPFAYRYDGKLYRS